MASCTAMRFFSRTRLAAWPGRRRGSETRRFIFLYHRIAAPRHDPYALAIPEGWFQDHLDILKSYCQLVSLDEILDTGAATSSRLASITFDDGYTDNLTTALPILHLAGIPVTFFICTGCLGDVRGFWWDRVASAIAAADMVSAEHAPLKILAQTADLNRADARTKLTLEVAARLQRMHPADRDPIVVDLEKILLAGGNGEPERYPVLDEAGVRALASQPLVQLGAHTHNHPMLSVLTRKEQLAEIDRSAAVLQDISGRRPRFLAYPYGAPADYNTDSFLVARDASFEAAFINHPAQFDPKDQPYRIPRYYVPSLTADDFRTWLVRTLGA
jgi:peptidoglycan/xylan/chitin deacetylase (PgdA/CDA1 family)